MTEDSRECGTLRQRQAFIRFFPSVIPLSPISVEETETFLDHTITINKHLRFPLLHTKSQNSCMCFHPALVHSFTVVNMIRICMPSIPGSKSQTF